MKIALVAAAPCLFALGGGGPSGWQIPFYGSDSRPVIADGIVYVGSFRGELHAVEVATGRPVWVFATGTTLPFSAPVVVGGEGEMAGVDAMTQHLRDPWPPRRVIDATPAVAHGTVYIASGDRVFSALDARSGAEQWRVDLPLPASGASAVDDRVFFTAGTQLFAYERGGRSVWTRDVATRMPDDSRRAPSVPIVQDHFVYVAAYDEVPAPDAVSRHVVRLLAIDRSTGSLRWEYRVNSSGVDEPLVTQGLVVATATYPEAVHAVDARTGTRRWVFTASSCAANVSPALSSSGRVVFATDCAIYGIDPTTGQPSWSTSGNWFPQSLIAGSVGDAELVVARSRQNDRVYAIDAASGKTLWSASAGEEAWPLAVDAATVYVSDGSAILGFERATGKRLWRRGTRAPVSAGPVFAQGRMCFASGVQFSSRTFGFTPVKGVLSCLDARIPPGD